MNRELIELLKSMVAIPSLSRDEGAVADFMEGWLKERSLPVSRKGNNLWLDAEPESAKPVLLLNGHIDTVKPAGGYTREPFVPAEEDGCIYGLGTNDDGGSVVALLGAYLELSKKDQPYHLIWSATAEEEVCGRNGIELMIPELPPVALGIIGEPTGMQMAVAEKGLMVLDCTAHGKSGHAARNEGVNAIYKALEDIEWFKNYSFEKVSPFLGPVKMSVTMVNAGTQHNVVPDTCTFVVDVRSNGLYSNKEILEFVKGQVSCDVKERSTRLNSSHIDVSHPVVQKGIALGLEPFGSPTTSNQAVVDFTTLKIGPGQSSRSHTADEFIKIEEISSAVDTFVSLLDGLTI
ncbi:MAG: M20 family metallo-hydrolase [Bacteroidia bacterium]|nr:M20 family metallo-hydrolase [Bacteroidia bacterium]